MDREAEGDDGADSRGQPSAVARPAGQALLPFARLVHPVTGSGLQDPERQRMLDVAGRDEDTPAAAVDINVGVLGSAAASAGGNGERFAWFACLQHLPARS